MLLTRSLPGAMALALVLAACGETPAPSENGASGGAATGGTAGAAGSPPLGGTTSGGSSGATGAGQGGAAPLGGNGGAPQGGSAGLAGSAGAPGGDGGASGLGGASGAAGQGGASGGGASGAAGSGAGGAVGGASGSAGNGGAAGGAGKGGAAGSGGTGGAPAYNPCPAAPAPCVILPFGDSITDGYTVMGGYRIELFRHAHSLNQHITFVGSQMNGPTMVDGVAFPQNHEGHSGYTIDPGGGRQGISPLVPAAMGLNPDIVLLMIGTNDLNINLDVANAPTRLGNLLDAIFTRSSHALVVVARIVPGRQETLNAKVQPYNAAIPGLVATRAAAGKHILSVDMYAAFTRDASYKTTLLADDLHPNTAGYTRMADTWYAAVGSLFH